MRHMKVSMLCVPIHVAMHFICSTGMAYGAISSSIGFAEAHILVPFGLATLALLVVPLRFASLMVFPLDLLKS